MAERGNESYLSHRPRPRPPRLAALNTSIGSSTRSIVSPRAQIQSNLPSQPYGTSPMRSTADNLDLISFETPELTPDASTQSSSSSYYSCNPITPQDTTPADTPSVVAHDPLYFPVTQRFGSENRAAPPLTDTDLPFANILSQARANSIPSSNLLRGQHSDEWHSFDTYRELSASRNGGFDESKPVSQSPPGESPLSEFELYSAFISPQNESAGFSGSTNVSSAVTERSAQSQEALPLSSPESGSSGTMKSQQIAVNGAGHGLVVGCSPGEQAALLAWTLERYGLSTKPQAELGVSTSAKGNDLAMGWYPQQQENNLQAALNAFEMQMQQGERQPPETPTKPGSATKLTSPNHVSRFSKPTRTAAATAAAKRMLHAKLNAEKKKKREMKRLLDAEAYQGDDEEVYYSLGSSGTSAIIFPEHEVALASSSKSCHNDTSGASLIYPLPAEQMERLRSFVSPLSSPQQDDNYQTSAAHLSREGDLEGVYETDSPTFSRSTKSLPSVHSIEAPLSTKLSQLAFTEELAMGDKNQMQKGFNATSQRADPSLLNLHASPPYTNHVPVPRIDFARARKITKVEDALKKSRKLGEVKSKRSDSKDAGPTNSVRSTHDNSTSTLQEDQPIWKRREAASGSSGVHHDSLGQHPHLLAAMQDAVRDIAQDMHDRVRKAMMEEVLSDSDASEEVAVNSHANGASDHGLTTAEGSKNERVVEAAVESATITPSDVLETFAQENGVPY